MIGSFRRDEVGNYANRYICSVLGAYQNKWLTFKRKNWISEPANLATTLAAMVPDADPMKWAGKEQGSPALAVGD